MKTYTEVKVHLHALVTSALDGDKWSSRSDRFTPEKRVSLYPLDRRLGGPKSRSGGGSEKKNINTADPIFSINQYENKECV
jgi:hypothetical protein